MQLKGKKVIFLGDSITQGFGTDSPEKIYHAVMKKDLGLAEIRNEGVNGTRIARQDDGLVEAREDFNKRYDRMNKDADVLFIFGGTNDFGGGTAKIGNIDDEDVYTFYGGLNTLLKKAIRDFGKNNVIVLMPMHRFGENNPKGNAPKGAVGSILCDYVNIIKDRAEFFGVHLIDLFSDERLNPNTADGVKFFLDGLHPNNEGHNLLAKVIEENLENLKD